MLPPPGLASLPPQEEALNHALATAVTSLTSSLLTATQISSSLLATATTTATSSPTGAPSGPHGNGEENTGECQLLGPFALFIQGALGALALMSLVFKRWRERPQRPVKIWAFDASKQVVGTFLVHLANLAMSMLSAGELDVKDTAAVAQSKGGYQPNPCSFYLLNLAIDTTIGIPILILFLRVLTRLFLLTPFGSPAESIESGNYGSPPKTRWWMKQCLIYFLGLMGMKLCVLLLFALLPWISRIGDWALRWTEGDERVQVFFVMLFFPLIMNALQYYIIDGFIKATSKGREEGHERVPTSEEESDRNEGEARDSFDDDENRVLLDRDSRKSDDEELDSKKKGKVRVTDA